MRYRMMATYRGVPYEAGIGPSGSDVVLFAACPPPEELGFEPATGHWRKRVIRAEVDALWESRPVGTFRGEPCIVLDDLGDRLHIAYLGTSPQTAARLGYWQVDRGVFELLAPREDVAGLTEERVDKPLRLAPPPARTAPGPSYPYGQPAPGGFPGPAAASPPFHAGAFPGGPLPGSVTATGPLPGGPVTTGPLPVTPAATGPLPGGPVTTGPLPVTRRPGTPASGGRSARRQRVRTREIFCELADLAAIPRAEYALEAEVDGAMCLLQTAEGFEVFVSVDGARHEARSFADEEAAYFYLFGVLAADAVRSGLLAPAGSPATARAGLI